MNPCICHESLSPIRVGRAARPAREAASGGERELREPRERRRPAPVEARARDRSCGPARRARGRPRQRSDSAAARPPSRRARRVVLRRPRRSRLRGLRARCRSRSRCSRRGRASATRRHARRARRTTRTAAARRRGGSRNAPRPRRPRIVSKYGCASQSSRLVNSRSIASPPYSPGGRLIEWTHDEIDRARRRAAARSSATRTRARRRSQPSRHAGARRRRLAHSRSAPPVSPPTLTFEARHAVAHLAQRQAEADAGRGAIEAMVLERAHEDVALDLVEVAAPGRSAAAPRPAAMRRAARAGFGRRSRAARLIRSSSCAALSVNTDSGRPRS